MFLMDERVQRSTKMTLIRKGKFKGTTSGSDLEKASALELELNAHKYDTVFKTKSYLAKSEPCKVWSSSS